MILTNYIKIKKRKIGKNNPTYIVAEAGINHNGDLRIAKKMIKSASKCGVDAIKFQTIFADELFSKYSSPKLNRLVKKWYLSRQDHLELKNHAKQHNIDFFSTPVGSESANLLISMGIKPIKIASGELTNHQMISEIAKTVTPMIISTGMSTIDEISSVVKLVKNKKCPFILMHCNSSYPTPLEDANLNSIPFLEKKYGVPIGYSDHTLGIQACLAAVSLGACIIEKHFTIDKRMKGPDQKLSSDPEEFKNLVHNIRLIEKTFGKPRKNITKSEIKFRKLMRKSIIAKVNISKDTIIKKSMLSFSRPGTGFPPSDISKILGKKIRRTVKKGEIIKKQML